eukprot:3938127-Rhodomonas_salina.1
MPADGGEAELSCTLDRSEPDWTLNSTSSWKLSRRPLQDGHQHRVSRGRGRDPQSKLPDVFCFVPVTFFLPWSEAAVIGKRCRRRIAEIVHGKPSVCPVLAEAVPCRLPSALESRDRAHCTWEPVFHRAFAAPCTMSSLAACWPFLEPESYGGCRQDACPAISRCVCSVLPRLAELLKSLVL